MPPKQRLRPSRAILLIKIGIGLVILLLLLVLLGLHLISNRLPS